MSIEPSSTESTDRGESILKAAYPAWAVGQYLKGLLDIKTVDLGNGLYEHTLTPKKRKEDAPC